MEADHSEIVESRLLLRVSHRPIASGLASVQLPDRAHGMVFRVVPPLQGWSGSASDQAQIRISIRSGLDPDHDQTLMA